VLPIPDLSFNIENFRVPFVLDERSVDVLKTGHSTERQDMSYKMMYT
jgi:hypothetical protein